MEPMQISYFHYCVSESTHSLIMSGQCDGKFLLLFGSCVVSAIFFASALREKGEGSIQGYESESKSSNSLKTDSPGPSLQSRAGSQFFSFFHL